MAFGRYAHIPDDAIHEECEEDDGSGAESESSEESDEDDSYEKRVLQLQEQVRVTSGHFVRVFDEFFNTLRVERFLVANLRVGNSGFSG